MLLHMTTCLSKHLTINEQRETKRERGEKEKEKEKEKKNMNGK